MAGISSSLLFDLAILLSASFLIGEIFERIGLESIIGYIITGLLLGPSVLDLVNPDAVAGFGTARRRDGAAPAAHYRQESGKENIRSNKWEHL